MSYTSGAVIIELVASVMVEVEYANYTLISGNIPVLGISISIFASEIISRHVNTRWLTASLTT